MKYKEINSYDENDYLEINKQKRKNNVVGVAISVTGIIAVMHVMANAPAYDLATTTAAITIELGLTVSMLHNFYMLYNRGEEKKNLLNGYTTLYDEKDLEYHRNEKGYQYIIRR